MKDPNHGDTIWLEPMTIQRPQLTPLQLARLAEGQVGTDDKAQLTAAIEKRSPKPRVTSSTHLRELIFAALDAMTSRDDILEFLAQVERLFKDYTGPEDATAIHVRRVWREIKVEFLADHLAKLKGEYQAANKTSIVVLAVSAGLAEKVKAANPERLRISVHGDGLPKFERTFLVA